MAQTKLTKVNKIDMLLEMVEVQANPMLVEFLENEKVLIQKKNSTRNVGKDNEDKDICDMLVEELAKIGSPVTISELMAQSVVVKNFVLSNGKMLTNPKITAMLKTMLGTRVQNIKEGRKSLYSVID
jgi:hypothetical protein